MKKQELIELWERRLARYRDNADVVKGMDETTAMGVQHGRIVALEQCIAELKMAIKEAEK